MSKKSKFLKIILPLLLLASGFVLMRVMIEARPEPEQRERRVVGPLVDVAVAEQVDHRVRIHATGTVAPSRVASIVPQVSGKIVHTATDLKPGGFFTKGDLLFRIEDTDYRLAVEQAKSAMAKARYDLEVVRSQAEVARQEWKSLGEGEDAPNPLVLYEPQLENARAALESARAALELARLNLARTRVEAPFACRIRSEEVETGQYVRSGNPVAVLTGTETAEVLVPLSISELSWIDVPRSNGEGSPAEVMLGANGRRFTWKARVVRSLGEVDEQGRMSRVVLLVRDPYGLEEKGEKRPPLEMGTFVRVVIQGEVLQDVVPVPRGALREGGTVWVVGSGNKLQIRDVTIARLEQNTAFVREGLSQGEEVILTPVSGAAPGMRVRTERASGDESAAAGTREGGS